MLPLVDPACHASPFVAVGHGFVRLSSPEAAFLRGWMKREVVCSIDLINHAVVAITPHAGMSISRHRLVTLGPAAPRGR